MKILKISMKNFYETLDRALKSCLMKLVLICNIYRILEEFNAYEN